PAEPARPGNLDWSLTGVRAARAPRRRAVLTVRVLGDERDRGRQSRRAPIEAVLTVRVLGDERHRGPVLGQPKCEVGPKVLMARLRGRRGREREQDRRQQPHETDVPKLPHVLSFLVRPPDAAVWNKRAPRR